MMKISQSRKDSIIRINQKIQRESGEITNHNYKIENSQETTYRIKKESHNAINR